MSSRRLCACVAVSLLAGCGGSSRPGPSPVSPATATVLVGAGDIAVCGSSATIGTAALVDQIPGTVFTAGDNVYDHASADDFARCYTPTWGRFKDRTRPSPGNHDYQTAGAAAYFAYFGAAAGPAGLGYYSYDLGDWHVISLNSNVPAGQGSAQYEWLRGDLDRNRVACVAAYWHHPVFSSGRNGPQPLMQDAWRLLHQFGADVVINGHDHLYERFAPLDAFGHPDARNGIREFIAGTGGAPLYEFRGISIGSEVRLSTHGILKLTLLAGSYEWQFIPLLGPGDAGRDECH